MELQDKVCLITGASGAIGAAVARRFQVEGARLALTCRCGDPTRHKGTLATAAGRVVWYPLDVTKREQVQATTSRVESDFSRIDILVNCTGVVGPIGPLETLDLDQWTRSMEINLHGAVYLARAVLHSMKRRQRGKLIFFSGGGAAYGRPYFTAYSSSKTALVRFTESLAQELEAANIQVNAVAPGPIESRMWNEMRSAGAAGGPRLLEELKRMQETGGASADRAAGLTAFLASERSNRITGRLISALWDDWAGIDENVERLARSEAWTLRRLPLS